MTTVKVFHLTDAPADGTNKVSKHVSISELVNGYEYIGLESFKVDTGDVHENHPAEVFYETIDRWTFGPKASKNFLREDVRSLRPGDILLRTDTAEAVILTKDDYKVVSMKGIKGRTDHESNGMCCDPKTFPGYDPGSNVSFDASEHTYEEFGPQVNEGPESMADLFGS